MKLKISDQLSLPLDAATQTFAIMGIRGTGKTTVAVDLAEEFSKIGQPFVVYDPTGAWSGIKSSRDGKRPGYPVVIFGGERADVPLEETAGETIARVIVERRVPAILDCSLLRKGARIRFMADFCENLYHLNREALHFFVDEAHTIAPQKPQPEAARVLGAVEDIILQGRRRGLGMTVISQRPALVNTNVRTQCGTLITLRVIGPHDRKAIQEWTDAHGTPDQARELMASLPTLRVGEGWVWSPAWLGTFKRVHFRDRETFDSSATPEVGKKAVAPKAVAEIDLAALGEQIMATVEAKKASDPAALKKKIADLEKQLAKRPEAKAVEPEVKIVEKPVLKDGQLARVEAVVEKASDVFRGWLDRLTAELGELRATIKPAFAPPPRAVDKHMQVNKTIERPAIRQQPRPAKPVAEGDATLGKGESIVLNAVAQTTGGVTREQLTVLTGYKRSTRDKYVYLLKNAGLVDDSGDSIIATEQGIATLGDSFRPLPTGDALREHYRATLGLGEKTVLEAACKAYPDSISRDELSEQTGYKRSTRDKYIYLLSIRKLIKVDRDGVRASEELFD